MRVVCVGGGPAGLYTALLAKLRYPGHEVRVLERDSALATYGWGVVFWDDLLDGLFAHDPVSANRIRQAAVLWNGQQVRLPGQRPAHLGGYGFSIARTALLGILAERAEGLGVDIRYEQPVDDPANLPDADLVVAADGVRSALRDRNADHFGTTMQEGRNRYLWLGTSKVFDGFVFAFAPTQHGWVWIHGYPSAAGRSTCVVECAPDTWRGLGLDRLGDAAAIRVLEDVFADLLGGHSLLQRAARTGGSAAWQAFREVANQTWYDDAVALAGDAAHTTHFTIGSGTKLAMQDAMALAEVLPADAADLPAALRTYDERRRSALQSVQRGAHRSMAWFEGVDRRLGPDPDGVEFAFELWKRRGDAPEWRHRLHAATQNPRLRWLRREVSTGRRMMRARRWG